MREGEDSVLSANRPGISSYGPGQFPHPHRPCSQKQLQKGLCPLAPCPLRLAPPMYIYIYISIRTLTCMYIHKYTCIYRDIRYVYISHMYMYIYTHSKPLLSEVRRHMMPVKRLNLTDFRTMAVTLDQRPQGTQFLCTFLAV